MAKARSRRFFTTSLAVHQFRPQALYFDWIQSFILGKTLLVTLLKCFTFTLEITFLKQFRKLPVIHTVHNMQNHAGRWIKVERWMHHWFLHRCDRIRVYSETTKRKIVRLYRIDPDKVFVIYDVPFHHYYPGEATRKEGRQFLHLPVSAFVYLFFGMVKPYKGIEELIAAFMQIAGPEDYLVIAGTSDVKAYGQKIGALAGQHLNILFPNQFIDKEKVQYFCRAADTMVLPFRSVEHSGSVDLAMAFAKPVITINTPFMQSLLKHQLYLLFDHPAQLSDRMTKAKGYDLEQIGLRNLEIAEASNYKDFVRLFYW